MSKNVLGLAEEEILPKEFRRGQTLRFIMELPPKVQEGALKDYTPTCQLRRLDNLGPAGFIADIPVTWRDANKCVELLFEFTGDTSEWPVGPAAFDVLFSHSDGIQKRRSNPVRMNILDGVTQ